MATIVARKASLMLLSIAVLMSANANAQPPDRSHLKMLSMADLKASHLECDQAASTTMLDLTTASECSMISEELLKRGFDGSFRRMLEWWRSIRSAPKECMQDAGCDTP
jgi:hypothetical protein